MVVSTNYEEKVASSKKQGSPKTLTPDQKPKAISMN